MTLFHDHDAISICLLTWLRNRTRTPPSLISVRAVKGAGIFNNVKIAHIPTVLIFLSGLVEKLDQLGGFSSNSGLVTPTNLTFQLRSISEENCMATLKDTLPPGSG